MKNDKEKERNIVPRPRLGRGRRARIKVSGVCHGKLGAKGSSGGFIVNPRDLLTVYHRLGSKGGYMKRGQKDLPRSFQAAGKCGWVNATFQQSVSIPFLAF